MRQALTAFLVLFFGLGPLTAVLPASDESRLPACCRRLGAHHCAMAMQMAALGAGSGPAFSASSHCPMYPGPEAALLSAVYATLVSPAALPAAVTRFGPIPSPPAAILSTRGREVADRGPPTDLSL